MNGPVRDNWPYDQITLDDHMNLAQLLKVKVLPETFLIDPEGNVIAHIMGGLDQRKISQNFLAKIKQPKN